MQELQYYTFEASTIDTGERKKKNCTTVNLFEKYSGGNYLKQCYIHSNVESPCTLSNIPILTSTGIQAMAVLVETTKQNVKGALHCRHLSAA